MVKGCCNIDTGHCYLTYGPCNTVGGYVEKPDCSTCAFAAPPPTDSQYGLQDPKVLCCSSDPQYQYNTSVGCVYFPGTTCPENAKPVDNCHECYQSCCNVVYTDNTNTQLTFACTDKVNGGCPAGAATFSTCARGSNDFCNPDNFSAYYFCCYPDTGVCCDKLTLDPTDAAAFYGKCPNGGIPMTNCQECSKLQKSKASAALGGQQQQKNRMLYGTAVDSCSTGSYCKWWQCPATCQGTGAACSVTGQKYSCAGGTCKVDSNGLYDNCCDACNPPPTPTPTPPTPTPTPTPSPAQTDSASFQLCCKDGTCAPNTCPAGYYAQDLPVRCCQNGKCFGALAATGCPSGSTQVDSCNKCYQNCCIQTLVNNKLVNQCSPKTSAGCPAGATFVEDCSQCSGPVKQMYCCHPDLSTCCPYTSTDGSCPYGGIPTLDCTQCPYLQYPPK